MHSRESRSTDVAVLARPGSTVSSHEIGRHIKLLLSFGMRTIYREGSGTQQRNHIGAVTLPGAIPRRRLSCSMAAEFASSSSALQAEGHTGCLSWGCARTAWRRQAPLVRGHRNLGQQHCGSTASRQRPTAHPVHHKRPAKMGARMHAVASESSEGSAASAALGDSQGKPSRAESDPFCMETATLLAGFAFESYNQPSLSWEAAPDGTRTGMMSPAFLREYYDGVLAIDAVKAQLFRPAGLLPMQPLDTYMVLQVSGGQPVKCETVRGTEPRWTSGRFLYVRGTDATLSLSIYYEMAGQPKLLGRMNVAVEELRHNSVQLWGEQRALSGGGRVELKAQFVPFSDSNEQSRLDMQALAAELREGGGGLTAVGEQLGGAWSAWRAKRAVQSTTGTTGDRRGSRLTTEAMELTNPGTWIKEAPRGPRGASGVDWSDLGQAMGGAAQAGGVFEAVCFVENTRTNTQCGIWRQEESRTLVLSFRGTQQDAIADIITDLSFAQQPATLKAHEVTVSTPEEVLDAAAKLEDALAEALACVRAGDLEEAVLRAAEVEELRAALEEALRTQEAPPEGEAAAEDEEEREQQGSHRALDPAGVPMVHSGFYGALKSVLPRILTLVGMLTAEGTGWTVYVTGHSLGGALATLMSWEIEALRERDLPSVSQVVLYNFGSPRVGNTAFSRTFNAAISTAFRIVNNEDVVGRVPSATLPGGDWLQVGRTVLIRDTPDAPQDALWVQGERPSEPCPLSMDASVEGGQGRGGRMELLRSVLLGQGVGDHMEDAYHDGMAAAIRAWKTRKAEMAEHDANLGQADSCELDLLAVDNAARDEITAVLSNLESEQGSGGPLDCSTGLSENMAASEVLSRVRERVEEEGGQQAEVSAAAMEQAVRRSVRAEVQRRLSLGEWNTQDLSLLLRVVLTLGANLTPAASLLPVRMLIGVYSVALQAELGDRLYAELQLMVAERLSQGVADTVRGWTGKEDYQFGDLTRAAISKATGKEEYEFGDLSKAAMRSLSSRVLGSKEPKLPDGA